MHSWETRRFECVVTTSSDPTGDTSEWAAIDVTTAGGDPAGWTAGTWGTYNAGTDEATATSPTFGTAESTVTPDITLTEGTTYRILHRVRNATDAPGREVAVIEVD